MGFSSAIDTVNKYLKSPTRQTLLFSATVSPQIRRVAETALKRDFISIDTVPKDDVPTHLNVKQSYVVSPLSHILPTLVHAVETHRQSRSNNDAKIIIFANTTKSVQHLATVLSSLPNMDILCLHAKLDQRQRSRVSDRFRKARNAILVTTDVSARGVDYPGVTYVVQIGVPSSIDQYIHRIGRTGRAGKEGEGLLLLSNYEKAYSERITRHVPLKRSLDFDSNVIIRNTELVALVKGAVDRCDRKDAISCYAAFLGFYVQNSRDLGLSNEALVKFANEYATDYLGLNRVPSISYKTAQNLGLAKTRGITINREENLRTYSDDDEEAGGDRRAFKGGVWLAKDDGHRQRDFGARHSGDREHSHRGAAFDRRGGDLDRKNFGASRDRPWEKRGRQ